MLILLVCLLPVLPLSAQNLCESVLLLRDTTILPGETVALQAHGLFEYTWQPAEGLTNPHDSVQTVSPIVTTDYIVTGRYISGNLVPDGDFESGNGDFVSEYLNGTPTTSPYYSSYGILGAEGTYTINTTSANVHTNFGTHPCLDHTFGNGSGHCMYVNGASEANVIVWQEELYDIVPNTDYIFITWLATLSDGPVHSNMNELAHLQFSINGVTIGNIFNASSTTAQWNQFYQIWNSGNATSAVITILNQCTATSGNDFALDDISFSPMYTCVDTATVHVDYPIEALPDTVWACRGDNKTIYPMQNDEVDAVCGTLGTVLPEIVQAPQHAIVSTSANGGMQIHFDADFVGVETMYYRICCGTTCDTSAIVLISTGFESEFVDTACNQYTWNGVTYNNSGDYQQTLTAANGCDSIVTLHLTILKPTISIRSDNSLFCETHEMALRVESDYEQFEWNTGDLGESIVATEPGTYSVTGSNKFCSGTAQYTIPHCDFSVYIPNTITPGTPDDINDYLSLSEHVKSEIRGFEIIIFDRWGSVVFASVDKNFRWDGRVRGQLLQNVIYTYVMTYINQENQPVQKKGTILVL
jgi:gliding motility-associated-like protein